MSDASSHPRTDNDTVEPSRGEVSRRGVLRGVAVGGMALPLLAACGGESDGAAPAATRSAPSSATAGSGGSSGGSGGAAALASTADVPVGGGEILPEEKVVLTQPTKGDFKAFSAVCTHMQCLVAQIADGKIQCTCHGSEYSIKDGSVLGGPAPTPLAPVPIKVEGGEITRA